MVHGAFSCTQVGAVMRRGEVRFQHGQHRVASEFRHHGQKGIVCCGKGNRRSSTYYDLPVASDFEIGHARAIDVRSSLVGWVWHA